MKNFKKQILALFFLCGLVFNSNAQIAPGSSLTDSTDEAFLTTCFGGTSYIGTLLYSSDIHGLDIPTFHALCDNQGPTIVLYKDSINGQVFGGYTSTSWTSNSWYAYSPGSFLFNLTNDFKLNKIFNQWAIFSYVDYFPTFGGGHDIFAGTTFTGSLNYCNPHSYSSPASFGQTYIHGGSNHNDCNINQIEVYSVTTPSCDDGIICTKDTFYNGSCHHIPINSICDDGLFCNGQEICHPILGCISGTPPNLDDNIACTNDFCDEANDTIIHAQINCDIEWVGGFSIEWELGSNWDIGLVPNHTDVVTIPDVSLASGNFPLITPSVTLGDITVNTNASLTVATGIILDGTFSNNGTVTLQDGAYLDDFTNAGATYVGSIAVEIFAANGVSNDQRLISSPVFSPMFNEIADDLVGPWGTGAQGVNGVAVTVDDCSIPTLTSTSNYGNLFELNETLITNNAQCELEAWVVRSSGMLENARGYSAYLTNGSTFDFSGTPNTGYLDIPVSNSGSGVSAAEGWNLLGNPYPSPISRDDVITAGATDVQYFVTTGVYQGSYTAYSPGSNIAIAQGFQTHVNSSSLVAFDNSMRNTNPTTWYQNDDWFEYKLEVSVFGTNYADKTTLFYNNDATNAYEPMFDVRKRKSNAGHPTLSTTGANLDLTLNGMSTNDLGETVPLNLESGTNGTFTLSFEGMATFPTNTTIYVKDLQEDVVHNIANGDYIFTANTTDNAERFEIIFIPVVEIATTKVDCEGNAGTVEIANPNSTSDRTFEIISNNTVIATDDLVKLNENLAAGTYTLNVNDQYGGAQVYAVEIEAAEQIEANFTVSSTELFVGEVLMLINTTSNATATEWNINNTTLSNVNNATYTFYTAGIYEVELNVSNDECLDVKTETITVVNKTTGIETVNGEAITFYPNPANDVLYINTTTDINIEIVDILGKTVVSSSEKTINLENVATGIYIIQVYDTNNKLIGTEKLIKK